jgi:hypothetical protein
MICATTSRARAKPYRACVASCASSISRILSMRNACAIETSMLRLKNSKPDANPLAARLPARLLMLVSFTCPHGHRSVEQPQDACSLVFFCSHLTKPVCCPTCSFIGSSCCFSVGLQASFQHQDHPSGPVCWTPRFSPDLKRRRSSTWSFIGSPGCFSVGLEARHQDLQGCLCFCSVRFDF